jgi:uncharacterized protein YcgL (UPF0745 family)
MHDHLSYAKLFDINFPEVYIEQFGIAKVVMHLLVPEVYIEQFGIAKVVMHLLVPEVYIEQFGI